jgi:hypothetical protein
MGLIRQGVGVVQPLMPPSIGKCPPLRKPDLGCQCGAVRGRALQGNRMNRNWPLCMRLKYSFSSRRATTLRRIRSKTVNC